MSKYYPTNNQADYCHYVEGNNLYKKYGIQMDSKWRRTVNANHGIHPSQTRRYHPHSSSVNSVIYCNPKFTANSSQGTLPYESESEDQHRLRQGQFRVHPAHSAMRSPKCSNNSYYVNTAICTPPSYSHVRKPEVISKKKIIEYRDPYDKYQYPEETAQTYYEGKRHYENVLYHQEVPEEDEDQEEEPEEDEDTGSETDTTASKSYRVVNTRTNENVRTNYSVERMVKNLNNFNNQTGQKLHPQALNFLTDHIKADQRLNQKYAYTKSRYLDKTYEKAAKVVSDAKTKADWIQNLEDEPDKIIYNAATHKQSQLLKGKAFIENQLNKRQVAMTYDKYGNLYLGSEKLVKQINPQFSVIKPKTQERPDAQKHTPIPEEQQDGVGATEIAPIPKTQDNEDPVKLQREVKVPIKFSANSLFTQSFHKSKFPVKKGRASIARKSRRTPHQRASLPGVGAYTKIVQKCIEGTLDNMMKNREILLKNANLSKSDDAIQPAKLDELQNTPVAAVQQKTSEVKVEQQAASLPAKRNFKFEICDMLSKLEEIQNLLNKNKKVACTNNKLDTGTMPETFSETSFNSTEPDTASVQYSSSELTSADTPRSRKHAKSRMRFKTNIPIPETGESQNTEENLRKKLKTSENKSSSFMSTKSAILSLISNVSEKMLLLNQNSLSKKTFDDGRTDSQIFKNTFQSDGEHSYEQEASKIPVMVKSTAVGCNDRNKVYAKFSDMASIPKTRTDGSGTSSVNTKVLGVSKTATVSQNTSIVTVFPIRRKTESVNTSSAAESTRNNIDQSNTNKRHPCKLNHIDDSSSDNRNVQNRVRRKHTKGRRGSDSSSTSSPPGENSICVSSVLKSLSSAFCIIVDFLFRYFKNMFIF